MQESDSKYIDFVDLSKEIKERIDFLKKNFENKSLKSHKSSKSHKSHRSSSRGNKFEDKHETRSTKSKKTSKSLIRESPEKSLRAKS
jgi:hypothetical protein